MICETWWTDVSTTNINGYSLFRKDRIGKRGGGVCIYVDESIKSYCISNADLSNENIEQIWCSVEIGNEKILRGCYYRPGDTDVNYCKEIVESINTAKKLVESKKYNGLLIGGDFNFSTIKWNDECMGFNTVESYVPSNLFLDCLHDNFLVQNIAINTFQNNVDETTNVLDYIVTDSSNRILLIEHHPPLGSIDHGHHVITFYYIYLDSENIEKNKDPKLIYNKGNFNEFNAFLNQINWESIFSNLNIDECYETFLKIYNEGCRRFIPTKIFKKDKFTNSAWMTRDLKHLIKEKKVAWCKCRNSGSKNTIFAETYKSLNKQVKLRVKEAVKGFERSLANDAKKNPKRIYAYINGKTKIKESIRALRDNDDNIITDGYAIADCLNNYFASVFYAEDIDSLPTCEMKTTTKCIDPVFSEQVILTKLINLNTNKSTGVDKVHPKVLKECSDSLAKPLSLLFNLSYCSGRVPQLWLCANVTPLFKKGDKLNPSNYRPVSLTSVVCKVMESIIRDSIMQHLLANKLIISEQHGFVPKKSCCTNLLETMDLITQAIEDGYPINIIFLDFAKAFDTVAHTRLNIKLSAFGIVDKLLNWIKAFLNGRTQRVILGDFISK